MNRTRPRPGAFDRWADEKRRKAKRRAGVDGKKRKAKT
jgi:hypothetical protein